LKELRRQLDPGLPTIEFVKAYAGEIPVPQKSLAKLEERIENAQTTIFPRDNRFSFHRILVIDDAVGSGATLQAVAAKLKTLQPKITVTGFAIVGSLKGFEVIKEV
jgi:hypoxanthine phosphoribosyltransferase